MQIVIFAKKNNYDSFIHQRIPLESGPGSKASYKWGRRYLNVSVRYVQTYSCHT